MPPEQAQAISMLFPEDLASHAWFESFAELLAEIPNSHVTPGKVTLKATWPEAALPVVEIVEAPVTHPQLVFDLEQPLELRLGEFKVTSRPAFAEPAEVAEPFDFFERIED